MHRIRCAPRPMLLPPRPPVFDVAQSPRRIPSFRERHGFMAERLPSLSRRESFVCL